MHTTTEDKTPQDLEANPDATSIRWRLHVLASPDADIAGEALVLTTGTTSLGRDGAIRIADDLLSRLHLHLHVGNSGVVLEDVGSRNGSRVDGVRTIGALLPHGCVLRAGRTVLVLEADRQRAPAFSSPTTEVPGCSELARRLRSDLDLAARTGLPALLLGETGVGKEHAAAELHRRSRRRGPLVRMNVAAVPESLFESELFGHVAGAFTGASSARTGRIREAHGGTLVLDEIGELPLALQAKLLRVLEEGRVRPVGGNSDHAVDVRFVASTNADLPALVTANRFRRDLLARLRGCEVQIAPLRARLADLLDLADAACPHPGGAWRERLHPEAVERLLLHDWPDNLRELRGVLGRAAALAGDGTVRLEHLRGLAAPRAESTAAGPADWPIDSRQRPSATQLAAWLAAFDGNIGAVARHVGRHRRQVYRWLSYAGLPSDRRQEPPE